MVPVIDDGFPVPGDMVKIDYATIPYPGAADDSWTLNLRTFEDVWERKAWCYFTVTYREQLTVIARLDPQHLLLLTGSGRLGWLVVTFGTVNNYVQRVSS